MCNDALGGEVSEMSQSVEIPNPTQTPQPALEANCDTVWDVEESEIQGQDYTQSHTYSDKDFLDNHDENIEDSQEDKMIYI